MPRPISIVLMLALALASSVAIAQQPVTPGMQAQPSTRPQVQPVTQPRVAAATAPRRPFVVPPEHQAWLDKVLEKWEADSATVKNFHCFFKRDRYTNRGPNPNAMSLSDIEEGELGYHKPDRGSFHIKKTLVWTPKAQPPASANQPVQKPAGEYLPLLDANGNPIPGQRFVCNGKNVYQYRSHEKQLVVTPIPPQLQGQQIVNGPLPFIFGAKADDLKKRFWFKPAPKLCVDGFIGIHAKPKTVANAAEFTDIWIAIRNVPGKPLMPAGMQVVNTDGSWDKYVFHLDKAEVNGTLTGIMNALFNEPRTPIGWQKVIEKPRTQLPQQAQQTQPTQR